MMQTMVRIADVGLWVVLGVLAVYTLRHYFFTLNRLFGRHRQPFIDVVEANWPSLVVFVPAHNEGRVIRDSLDALLTCDYPEDRLVIVPIDDRSQDETREIILEYEASYPGRIKPHLRDDGIPGKAAALAEAMEERQEEVFLVFDADYIPGERLLKQLVAPFFDAEVGAVMGRVVPLNVSESLLTRLLDLERSGGYQVDQQARMNLRLVPQYGGTVGGVRRAALEHVGDRVQCGLGGVGAGGDRAHLAHCAHHAPRARRRVLGCQYGPRQRVAPVCSERRVARAAPFQRRSRDVATVACVAGGKFNRARGARSGTEESASARA